MSTSGAANDQKSTSQLNGQINVNAASTGNQPISKPPLSLVTEILSIYEEEKSKSLVTDSKFYSSKFTSPTLLCKECNTLTPVFLDSKAGDTICINCGVVLNEREVIETPFGRGAGGYSKGSTDSDKLDLLTGTKHKEHGRTRKYYKTVLKRKVDEEIDGLEGDNEQLAELAKAMFEKYSDRLEQVRDRPKVIQACIAAAKIAIKRKEKVNELAKLEFKCDKCSEVFGTKQDLRFHRCAKKLKS